MAFWWISLYVLKPSDPAWPVLDHCCCKNASLHSPQRQSGPVFFQSLTFTGWTILPSYISVTISTLLFFLLYKNPQANVFFFCSNSEENCLRKDVYRESWILHFATIQKAYAQVNICYRERFIDKPTHLDLLMLEDESVGACKFSPNTERVLRDVACSHKSFKTRFALKIILKVNPFLPPSFFPNQVPPWGLPHRCVHKRLPWRLLSSLWRHSAWGTDRALRPLHGQLWWL